MSELKYGIGFKHYKPEKPRIALSKNLFDFRADRPDEWTMDEFIREALWIEQDLSRTKAELEEAKRLLNDMAMGVHMAKVQGNVDYISNPDEAIEFLSSQQSEE